MKAFDALAAARDFYSARGDWAKVGAGLSANDDPAKGASEGMRLSDEQYHRQTTAYNELVRVRALLESRYPGFIFSSAHRIASNRIAQQPPPDRHRQPVALPLQANAAAAAGVRAGAD